MRSVLLALAVVTMALACSSDSNQGPLVDGGAQSKQCSFCGEEQECCNGQCVDTNKNVAHCGECGASCSTETANECSYGLCRCNGGPECQGGNSCCEDGCADLDSSSTNCGACGVTCGQGESCVAGACVCAADQSTCQSGDACCAEGCTDTSSDADNCGGCGQPCEDGEVCNGGECACGFTCPDSPVPGCCSDGCYDFCGDPNNCGGCGVTCGQGEACENGVCDGAGFPLFECLIPF